VDHKGLQMVSIPNSRDRVVAMQNGQVKGALLIAPFDTVVEKEGMKLLDVYKEPYVQTPLILNTSWASKNRKAAVGLTQALRKASDWIYDSNNRKEAAAILAAYTNTAPDIAEASYDFVVREQQAIGKGLRIQAPALENIVKIDRAVTGESASGTFDLKKYYDPSYLEAR